MDKKVIFGLLVASLILNTILIVTVERKASTIDEIPGNMAFWGIQYNIVQLEGAISYQRNDDNWKNPNHVIEKVEDVIEGINNVIYVSENTRDFPPEKKQLLLELGNYMTGFDVSTGFPNVELTEEQIQKYEELATNLQKVGWSSGFNSGWESFAEKANMLLDTRRELHND